ncbi:hypothetical protein CCUS01_08858 [Colletotrichum cuscutae]|uniref:Uncharacterized protein n=1 Tax=Colletotrichum cuscutae TaxID=1209917 RepID=A0AAI9XUE3_9PEZI|nr:hypothetical protein CCUS01_08858 [Colletotrichum cuscutae]
MAFGHTRNGCLGRRSSPVTVDPRWSCWVTSMLSGFVLPLWHF